MLLTADPSKTVRRTGDQPLAALGGVAVAAGLIATATGDDGLVLCPYRFCTGGYCPGCGGTRAARHLLGGDLIGAWHHHPWVVLAAAQLVAIVVIATVVRSLSGTVDWRRWRMPIVAVNTVALVAIWVARIAHESVPTGWL